MPKKKEAVIYAYDQVLKELSPILESDMLTKEEILAEFMSHSLLVEGKELQKGEAEVIAEAKRPPDENKLTVSKGESAESRTYSLTYYNPETNKAEVIEGKVDVRITDYATRMIEESLGIGSVYPLYAFVVTPLIRKEVVPWLLEEILNEREYGTPPATGSAPMIKVGKAGKKSEIVTMKKQEEIARDAVVEAITRKEDSEKKLSAEIVVFEEVVAAIRKGSDPESTVQKLPPLSLARYLALLKKKKIQRATLLALLGRDTKMLRSIKKKLEMLTAEELLGLIKVMKKIRKK